MTMLGDDMTFGSSSKRQDASDWSYNGSKER